VKAGTLNFDSELKTGKLPVFIKYSAIRIPQSVPPLGMSFATPTASPSLDRLCIPPEELHRLQTEPRYI